MRSMLMLTFLFAGVAWADGDWQAFSKTFSSMPCSNGWSSCMRDGQSVGVGMVSDEAGRFHPADMRVGFFDLQPLPNFSPFAKPQRYPVAEKPVVEVVKKEEPKEKETRKLSPEEQAELAAKREARRQEREEQRAERLAAKEQKRLDREAAKEQKRLERETSKEQKRLEREAAKEKQRLEREAEAEKKRLAKEEEDRKKEQARLAAKKESEKKQSSQQAVIASTQEETTCTNLVSLESPAMMGRLTSAQQKCLERRRSGGASLTTKRKINLVLINNAKHSGNKGKWAKHVKYHLEKIDQSNPNLTMAYTIYIFKRGKYSSAIRWARRSLENKHIFQGGSDFVKKVNMLYRIKATSANKLWQSAEKKVIKAQNDEKARAKAQKKAEKWKGKTKDYSREWLDYARKSGQDTRLALQMCVSAADTGFCR